MVDYRLGFHRLKIVHLFGFPIIVTASPPIETRTVDLPPVLQSQLDGPSLNRRSWLTTIAPAYLGVFVWIPFLDPLGVVDSASTGVLGRFLSAVLALVCCHALLYYAPAMLGWRSGRRLSVVAAESLGTEGSEWITGVLYGLFAAVWCAVAIYYSVKLTLLGLISCNLLDPSLVQPWDLWGLRLENPVVLVALANWLMIIAAANGLRLMNVISALMKVYAPVAALLLGAAALWALIHLPTGAFMKSSPTDGSWLGNAELEPRIFQLIFGYFAFAGLMSVEWGSVVERRKDVRLGGWVGILAAGTFTILAGLILAASDPLTATPAGVSVSGLDWDVPSGSIQGALFRGIGSSLGNQAAGALLLLFGLASLAPACYASAVFSDRCRGHWPLMRKRLGGLLGYGLIFAITALSLAARVETIFTISGALFAPVAGVLTAEAVAKRGGWTGMRSGWHLPGIAAWGVGLLVGLAPVVGELAGASWLRSIQPAALFAYLSAVVVYGLAVWSAPKSPVITVSRFAGPEES